MHRLLRDPFTDIATTGRLILDDHVLHTIERPWIPTSPGGKPSESCVPAGLYKIISHIRPESGDNVVALVNPGLGVFYKPTERPNDVGRFFILIHAANWVNQIEGCIAPGIGRADGPMVTQSRKAMEIVMQHIGDELLIEDTY